MRCMPRVPLLALAVSLVSLSPAVGAPFDHTHALFGAVLKTHVSDGLVDYRALKANPQTLDRYLDALAAASRKTFDAWPEPQRLAYLINLYNAATLRLVVDHYPVKSIRDIRHGEQGPWDRPVVRLFGGRVTLNHLEHEIVRKQYDEPRIHMALVCAAKSCPPLRGEPFVADRLDKQLEEQSRRFLKSPAGLQIDRGRNEARLSAIFKWYGKDFPSVRAFAEQHSGKRLQGLDIRYLDYDWSLNATRE
jgi:hypothetical protein